MLPDIEGWESVPRHHRVDHQGVVLSDGTSCGGVYSLAPDPHTMVINALQYVKEQTGEFPKLAAIDVALIAESLVSQGAFRGWLAQTADESGRPQ